MVDLRGWRLLSDGYLCVYDHVGYKPRCSHCPSEFGWWPCTYWSRLQVPCNSRLQTSAASARLPMHSVATHATCAAHHHWAAGPCAATLKPPCSLEQYPLISHLHDGFLVKLCETRIISHLTSIISHVVSPKVQQFGKNHQSSNLQYTIQQSTITNNDYRTSATINN